MHLILHLTRTLKAREGKLLECASFNSAFFVRTPPAKNRLHPEEASSSMGLEVTALCLTDPDLSKGTWILAGSKQMERRRDPGSLS